MRISDVLRVKGGQVVTVTPDTDVRRLLTVLAEHRIGAVVVSHDGTSVDGIASERDIVRALAQRGAAVLSEPITAIYTAEVHTVTPQTPVEEVMRIMTEHRVRHAPVVVDGGLQGIVSIGDVVKNRIDELETERAHLTNYITGTANAPAQPADASTDLSRASSRQHPQMPRSGPCERAGIDDVAHRGRRLRPPKPSRSRHPLWRSEPPQEPLISYMSTTQNPCLTKAYSKWT
jgi:CBS domain-containing protein